MVAAVFISLVPIVASAAPGQLYSWKDDKGVVHYSDRPQAKSAKPTDLPPISRGEVKVPKSLLKSCVDHGGVGCGSGPDNDGSVICLDGFRGSHQPFRASCGSPKLEIAEIGVPDRDGRFSVSLRNLNAAPASEVLLVFKPATDQEFNLRGPETIEGYGVADYVFDPKVYQKDGIQIRRFSAAPDAERLSIRCPNCR